MGVQRDTLDTSESQSFVSYEQKDINSHYHAKQQIPSSASYTQRDN